MTVRRRGWTGGGQHSEKGGGGQSKALGQQEALSTATTTMLTMMRGEEAIAMITIMATITRTKAGGGCKGTAHPGVGTTDNVVMIVLNANTRSSLMTTSASATAVMMAMLSTIQGGLA
jgi:hypothetical protein